MDPTEPDHEEVFDDAEQFAPFRPAFEPASTSDLKRIGVQLKISDLEAHSDHPCGTPLGGVAPDLREQIVCAARGPRECGDGGLPEAFFRYLGGADPVILPRPQVLPDRSVGPVEVAGKAAVLLCASLRDVKSAWAAVEEHVGGLAGLATETMEHWDDDSPGGYDHELSLLDESEFSVVHHPAARFVCEVIDQVTNELLPDFIKRNYWLEVGLAPAVDIVRGRAVSITMCRKGRDERDQPFEFVGLAQGYQLLGSN